MPSSRARSHTSPSAAMAPVALANTTFTGNGQASSPAKRGWTEDRAEIPSILIGRGQENASTTRHNLEQNMDLQGKPSEGCRYRGRHNSLKRVKNSTDILRQRSLKRNAKDVATEASTTTREGKHFTVANVGSNGKIYLR